MHSIPFIAEYCMPVLIPPRPAPGYTTCSCVKNERQSHQEKWPSIALRMQHDGFILGCHHEQNETSRLPNIAINPLNAKHQHLWETKTSQAAQTLGLPPHQEHTKIGIIRNNPAEGCATAQNLREHHHHGSQLPWCESNDGSSDHLSEQLCPFPEWSPAPYHALRSTAAPSETSTHTITDYE